LFTAFGVNPLPPIYLGGNIHDKGFLTVIIDEEIKAGDKLSFAEAWDMKDNDGNKVVPGNFW
jgi:hypothetical protein